MRNTNKTLFRDDDRTVVKLNPDWMEGLYHTAKTNQSLLAIQYAARLIEELVERVGELERKVQGYEDRAAQAVPVTEPKPTKSGATTIADQDVVLTNDVPAGEVAATKPARRTAKKAAESVAE